MDMIALGAAGVVAALCAVVVRQKTPEIAVVLVAAACVLLLWNTLPLLETIRDVMEELADLADISPTVLRPMLQTVGLALVTKLAASLCRDAGEGGVASFVEVAGAAAAVLVSLPLLKMVLQLVMALGAPGGPGRGPPDAHGAGPGPGGNPAGPEPVPGH